MTNRSAGMASALGVLLCAGCVQTPRVNITKNGDLPTAASSFAFVEPLDSPAGVALSACLAAHGMQVSAKPAYLAQLIETDRPGGVGILAPQPAAEKTPDATTWLPGAAPDRWAARSLTLSLIKVSTGQVIYRIGVSEPYRPKAKPPAPTDLAQIACSNLVDPPVPAAG